MKRILSIPFFAYLFASLALCGNALCGNAFGEDRASLLKQYRSLELETLSAIDAGKVKTVDANINNRKFSLVVPCDLPNPSCLGVKIWGQLVDKDGNLGDFVNLTKHKWERKERFLLYLQTAFPVQLAFFQNFPAESGKDSIQISPDERFPATFATVMPGLPYQFPVMIEMDDNLIDEQMSIVIVRADAGILPCNGGTDATATAVANATTVINASTLPPGTTVTVDTLANATASIGNASPSRGSQSGVTSDGSVFGPGGTLKSLDVQSNKSAFVNIHKASTMSSEVKGRTKLRLVSAPPASAPAEVAAVTGNIDDVSTVMLGPGRIAQIELQLHKD